MSGLAGNDFLFGEIGNDTLYGDNGNDFLFGGDNNDFLIGGEGIDRIYGGSGDDNLQGWGGNDELIGNDGNNYLVGSGASTPNRNDRLDGGNGTDTLIGEFGNDNLIGGDGNDLLNGAGRGGTLNEPSFGSGEIDTLTGGNGTDNFQLYSGGRGSVRPTYTSAGNGDYALITDFNKSVDVISLLKAQFVAGSSPLTVEYSLGTSPAGLPSGTALYADNLGTQPDLVAILQGVAPNSVTLEQPYFQIV